MVQEALEISNYHKKSVLFRKYWTDFVWLLCSLNPYLLQGSPDLSRMFYTYSSYFLLWKYCHLEVNSTCWKSFCLQSNWHRLRKSRWSPKGGPVQLSCSLLQHFLLFVFKHTLYSICPTHLLVLWSSCYGINMSGTMEDNAVTKLALLKSPAAKWMSLSLLSLHKKSWECCHHCQAVQGQESSHLISPFQMIFLPLA